MLIESFYAGPLGRRRYCSLHRPATRLVRDVGVVLCHPLGHEYFRSYRCYFQLADALSRAGIPVLRFDYAGTGDSEGDHGDARLDAWLDQVADSATELLRSESVERIALGGMRFGATIAALAAERIENADVLLLWDVVENGARYVDELSRLHREMIFDLERFVRARDSELGRNAELMGWHYGHWLLEDIRHVRERDIASARGNHILLLGADGAQSASARRLSSRPGFRQVRLDTDHGWNRLDRAEESIVDPQGVQRAAELICEVAA